MYVAATGTGTYGLGGPLTRAEAQRCAAELQQQAAALAAQADALVTAEAQSRYVEQYLASGRSREAAGALVAVYVERVDRYKRDLAQWLADAISKKCRTREGWRSALDEARAWFELVRRSRRPDLPLPTVTPSFWEQYRTPFIVAGAALGGVALLSVVGGRRGGKG